VRDGIRNHSKSSTSILEGWPVVGTVEAQVVRIADTVAYINHDLDDAVRAGTIRPEELPVGAVNTLGSSRSERINSLVTDIILCSHEATSGQAAHPPLIDMSREIREATEELRQFLFEHVYNVQSARREAARARKALRQLYRHLTEEPNSLIAAGQRKEGIERQAVDYIAGMTDQYALSLARTTRHTRTAEN
jgi:dGTPase